MDAVAGESDTANNCSTSVQVTVLQVVLQTQQQLQGPSRPDLEVGTPSVSDNSPAPGASFTLSATVQNDGNGESAATTLRYYRSTDATITTSDTEVGTDAVAGLAASGSDRQSVELAAPSAPGTYHYGACVDAVAGESDTANNCSTSVQVTVREPDHPDLTAVSPSVSDNSPAPGASFTLSATVQNDGNGESAATTLRYYRSTDATITTSDTEVGTDAVAGLAASGSDRQSVELAAPSAPGTYHYGACVDAVAGESDTANNCSTSMQVTVREPDHPDLTAVSPSVSNSSPAVGSQFTLSATVQNDGNGESAATTLRYYRSTDATITTSDTEVGTAAVAGLAASGSDRQSVELVAPSAPGTYYYGACVDAVVGESDTANNCSTSVQVTVREPDHPDLTAVSPSVSDNSPAPGASFTLSATVQNDGNGESAATTLRYYRSTDATITTSDPEVGTDAVAGLAASGSDKQSVELVAASAPGTYYYGACVDAVVGESNTANNCSTSVQVTVLQVVLQTQQQLQGRPDLEVGTPTVSDNSPAPGASFTLSVTVQNDGNGESAATTLRYYRSVDDRITAADKAVGTADVGVLAAAGTSPKSISLTAPSSPGPYYYGACVDEVTDESNTANNCSSAVEVTPFPTLQVQQGLVVGTPRVNNNNPNPVRFKLLYLRASVTNTDDARSGAARLRFYRSTDPTITTSDTFLIGRPSTVPIPALYPGSSSDVRLWTSTPWTPGTYYYGACVDTEVRGSFATNNCSSSVRVTVQAPAPTDLEMVGSPTASNSSPAAGVTFSLSATVRNAGDLDSHIMHMQFYRSTDAEITTSDTLAGLAGVGPLGRGWVHTGSVSLQAPSTPGPYYYGACVWSRGESDYTNNCSTSVLVDVVARQENTPDLVIPNLSHSVSRYGFDPGSTLLLRVHVRNEGDAPSTSATVRIYRSNDLTISTGDQEVASQPVAAVNPGATVITDDISVRLPDRSGYYYYGACVNGMAGEADTTNNCWLRSIDIQIW